MQKSHKLKFTKGSGDHIQKGAIETLAKTPYVPVDIEEKYDHIVAELHKALRINKIQIGRLYHNHESVGRPRLTFSAEWTKELVNGGAGWLKFDYASKLIRITVSFLCQPLISRVVPLTSPLAGRSFCT